MKILVVPLNWGLGHAARMVPVIVALRNKGHVVVPAGSGKALQFLQEEFPDLHHIRFSPFHITYAGRGNLTLHLIMRLPFYFLQILRIRKEFLHAIEIIKPDVVIADNHPGLWVRKIKTVYVTHQAAPEISRIFRIFKPLARRIHKAIIKRHTYCWIPDLPPPHHIAGSLSAAGKTNPNARYIGLLSRFNQKPGTLSSPIPDVLIVLSGPEPQRTMLESLLVRAFQFRKEQILIVRGMASKPMEGLPPHIHTASHLSTPALNRYLLQTPMVITRAGYSSIMDLLSIKKPALLIPTPGQPEQEYLGRRLKHLRLFVVQPQDKLDIAKAWRDLRTLRPQYEQWDHANYLDREIAALSAP